MYLLLPGHLWGPEGQGQCGSGRCGWYRQCYVPKTCYEMQRLDWGARIELENLCLEKPGIPIRIAR
jgi:hypothetical protein